MTLNNQNISINYLIDLINRQSQGEINIMKSMFNNFIKYKFFISIVFISFLINKETLAIITKSTGDIKYKSYLSDDANDSKWVRNFQ